MDTKGMTRRSFLRDSALVGTGLVCGAFGTAASPADWPVPAASDAVESAATIFYSEDPDAHPLVPVTSATTGEGEDGLGAACQAVAVDDKGRILFVGSNAGANRYRGPATSLVAIGKHQTMLPGLIEPHLHNFYALVFYHVPIISGDVDWRMPGVRQYQVFGKINFLATVEEALTQMQVEPGDLPFVAIGYASYFHGDISQSELAQLESTYERPVVIVQRSTHAAWLGPLAREKLVPNKALLQCPDQCDYDRGVFWEQGFILNVYPPLLTSLYPAGTPEAAASSLAAMKEHYQKFVNYIHSRGVTTTCEMMAQLGFNLDMPDCASGDGAITDECRRKLAAFNVDKVYRDVFDAVDSPIRSYHVACPTDIFQQGTSAGTAVDSGTGSDGGSQQARAEAAVAFIRAIGRYDGANGNLVYLPQAKLFMDGAFFAQMMQMEYPNGTYPDGHEGAWMTAPQEDRFGLSKLFWENDVPIHIHVNGDAGLQEVLEIYDSLRKGGHPGSSRNRVVLHHVGYASPIASEARAAQIRRIGEMSEDSDHPIDISVSLLPYYTYAVGRTYEDVNLGDKARFMSASGLFAEQGVPISLHGDFGMAPPNPLLTAWCAINRKSIKMNNARPEGYEVVYLGPDEARLSVGDAIRAVTIESARALGLQDDIGSIEVGKRADFVILDTTYDGLRQALTTGDTFAGVDVAATVKDGKLFVVGAVDL